jgi:hypothetical protein
MRFHSRSRDDRTSPVCRTQPRPLATCLAAVFSSAAAAASGDLGSLDVAPFPRSVATGVAAPLLTAMAPVTHLVTTCNDPDISPLCDGHDDGTLRKAFTCAGNGDTIDLRQLQCSKITLSQTLVAREVTLGLLGPGQDKLTIDAGGKFRAFAHYTNAGHGLYINDLTIANGRYAISTGVISDGLAYGGCIFSSGYVNLNSSTVSSCSTSSAVRTAGGAIFSTQRVSLYRSTVTDSTAQNNSDGSARGGGISADLVELAKSTVSGNTASATGAAEGGGISANVFYGSQSTISGNAAKRAAGILAHEVHLTSSTVSGNQTPPAGAIGGIYAAQLAQVFNSTIAGNTGGGNLASGLYIANPGVDTIVHSTIIANNKASGVEIDIGTPTGKAIFGSSNLINAHPAGTSLPADTIAGDARLGLLRDNGGPTHTLELLPGSAAIDKGSNAFGVQFDQRGVPRVEGSAADIGAFESDRLFANGFDPP